MIPYWIRIGWNAKTLTLFSKALKELVDSMLFEKG